MNPKLKRAREAYAEACAELEARSSAYTDAPEDATQEQLDELSRAFDEAKAEAEKRKKEVDRLEEIEEQRAAAPGSDASPPTIPSTAARRRGRDRAGGLLEARRPPLVLPRHGAQVAADRLRHGGREADRRTASTSRPRPRSATRSQAASSSASSTAWSTSC
jgi:hypothetical protein